LRDHRDLVPQVSNVQLGNVDPIYLNRASHQLNYASQSHTDGRFSSSSATHNSNFLAWADCKCELAKHNLSVGAITKLNILKCNLALAGPLCFNLLRTYGSLLGRLLQIEDFLDVDHHSHEPVVATEHVHEPLHIRAVSEEDD